MRLSARFAVGFVSLTATASAAYMGCGSDTATRDDAAAPTPTSPGTTSSDGGTAVDAGSDAKTTTDATVVAPTAIKTVFIILMENHSWSTIKGAGNNAKYINQTLLPLGAHAEQYMTPPGLHPSEPNYIWLEAGDNLGITNDKAPSDNHQSTKDHLTSQLEAKGISWKAYAEDMTPGSCPLTAGGRYDPKHTPQMYFDDVTDTNDPNSQHCKDHIKVYSEFATDLAANKVARYNFITPNLCNDMHGEISISCPLVVNDGALIKHGDDWLAAEIPKIMASPAYKDNGAIFITWDEGDEKGIPPKGSDGPIGMIVLSPLAKVNFTSNTAYTHSSTLRTMETIFGVPFLRGAANSNDLSEMFTVPLAKP